MAYIGNSLVIIDENRVDIEPLHFHFNRLVFKQDAISNSDKLKNSRLYIMLEGEEIYTKVITIPKVNKSSIFNIVKTELSCYFKNIDDLLFTYKVIEKTKSKYKLLIFYINSSQIDFIRKNENILVKKITPIQILARKYFIKKIDCSNYIIVFNYNKYCYFTLYLQNNITASYVDKVNCNFEETYIEKFYSFFEKYCENAALIHKIYFINFPYKNGIAEISKKYTCVNLGYLNREEIISLY